MFALAGSDIITSNDPSIRGFKQQVEDCRDFSHHYASCGFNLGGGLVGGYLGISSLPRTNVARAAVVSAYLAFTPMEVESAEAAGFAAFARGASVPFETGPLTSPAAGTFSSLAGPTDGFKKLTDFEQWLASQRQMSNVGDGYAELLGLDQVAGLGVELEAGGAAPPTQWVPERQPSLVGPRAPAALYEASAEGSYSDVCSRKRMVPTMPCSVPG